MLAEDFDHDEIYRPWPPIGFGIAWAELLVFDSLVFGMMLYKSIVRVLPCSNGVNILDVSLVLLFSLMSWLMQHSLSESALETFCSCPIKMFMYVRAVPASEALLDMAQLTVQLWGNIQCIDIIFIGDIEKVATTTEPTINFKHPPPTLPFVGRLQKWARPNRCWFERRGIKILLNVPLLLEITLVDSVEFFKFKIKQRHLVPGMESVSTT